jgi:hypothetical protein
MAAESTGPNVAEAAGSGVNRTGPTTDASNMPDPKQPVPSFVVVGAFVAAATLAIVLGHGSVRAAGFVGLALSIMPAIDDGLARWIRLFMIGVAAAVSLLFLPGTQALALWAFGVGTLLQAAMLIAEALFRRLGAADSDPSPGTSPGTRRALAALHDVTHRPGWADRSPTVRQR